jgi:hypothetical protein
MVSFTSILSAIGNGLKKFFGIVLNVAVAAEPIIDVVLPGIATLYNLTVNEVVKAESAAIAAGQQSGTGAQKLALVLEAITPAFQEYAKATGVPSASETATITAWINGVVATLNAIPSTVSTQQTGNAQ